MEFTRSAHYGSVLACYSHSGGPRNESNYASTNNKASGDYRNHFKHAGNRYSQPIDPRTGHPVVHDAVSVTVGWARRMATAKPINEPAGVRSRERCCVSSGHEGC
ncbi:MAG: FAD:protein FMN transferase [Proteobacteria bacterium]|nr:FAD:protein FMN transferase [Pseudomonadota bacterium]